MNLLTGIHLYRSSFRAQLVQNLLLGLVISTLLWNFQSVAFIDDLEAFSIDWVNRLQQYEVESGSSASYALLDIDEASWREWNNPLYMPRSKLLTILDYATNSRAKVVVVDIDLGSASDILDDDITLQDFLQSYDRLPRLILIKRIQEIDGEYFASPSFLDDVVKKNPKLDWASAYFQIADNRKIRRSYLSVRLQGGTELPSAQSLIASDFVSGSSVYIMPQRIFFRLPWLIPKGVQIPLVKKSNRSVPLYEKRGVLPLVGSANRVSSEWLEDQIVVIGSSVRSMKDNYLTSLGAMPGYFVIANAIHSHLEMGVITQPSIWITLLIELLAITLMSYSFTRFTSFPGLLFSSAIFIIAIIPVCIWLLELGMWFNLVIPLLTVQVMHLIYKIDEHFRYRNE